MHPSIPYSSPTPSVVMPPVAFSRTASSIRDRTVEFASMPPISSVAVGSPRALDYFTQRTQSRYDSQADVSPVPSSFIDKPLESPLLQMRLSSSRPDPSHFTLRLNGPSSPIAYREPIRNPSTSLSPTLSPNLSPNIKSPYSGSDDEDDEDSDPTPRRTPIKVSKNGRIPIHNGPSTETSSLLGTYAQSYNTLPVPAHSLFSNRSLRKRARGAWRSATNGAKTVSQPSYLAHLGLRIISLIPAVFLAVLLNVLDGVSYGMILFPPVAVFDGFGPMGVSLFFITYVFSALSLESFLILARLDRAI